MFIEHIDRLRCTADHEESWLVASLARREDRFVVQGMLGCHICLRQYPIIQGVAYFGSVPTDTLPAVYDRGDAEIATRVAAFLNVTEHSTIVLAGEWALQGHMIAEMLPLTVFALNPSVTMQDSTHLAVISSSRGIPLASESAQGVALDITTATPENVASALKILRPGGRLVAPTSIGVFGGVRVLARDESYWVGEKDEILIPLRRS